MLYRFPYEVDITLVDSIPPLTNLLFSDEYAAVNEHEFAFFIDDVANFYLKDGEAIQIEKTGEASDQLIELYLNGSVLGAYMHQSGRLPIHGSSFTYANKTLIVCGYSGAGKSTLTASFIKKGARFLTDDITPLELNEAGELLISPISERMKLWSDSIEKLGLQKTVIGKVQNDIEKYVIGVELSEEKKAPDLMLLLSYDDSLPFTCKEIKGSEKFTTALNQIYRKEYLEGMPSKKSHYFPLLIQWCEHSRFYAISRPQQMSYESFTMEIEAFLNQLERNE